jgi:hypothetical protein
MRLQVPQQLTLSLRRRELALCANAGSCMQQYFASESCTIDREAR